MMLHRDKRVGRSVYRIVPDRCGAFRIAEYFHTYGDTRSAVTPTSYDMPTALAMLSRIGDELAVIDRGGRITPPDTYFPDLHRRTNA